MSERPEINFSDGDRRAMGRPEAALMLNWRDLPHVKRTIHELFCGGYFHFMNANRVELLFRASRSVVLASCQDCDETIHELEEIPAAMIVRV